MIKAYNGESIDRHQYVFLSDFQFDYPLRLLLLRVNYIQLQRRINNFHGLPIKTKRNLVLKSI